MFLVLRLKHIVSAENLEEMLFTSPGNRLLCKTGILNLKRAKAAALTHGMFEVLPFIKPP
ncbi:MAG: hypothetical protein CME32_15240 [Gimesia sp.]|nr:hypothetical protein [Gimesia sp.]